MKPSLLAIRSIGAEFANRLFVPIVITAAVIAVLLVGVTVWLSTLSPYWLLLFFPIIILICVGLTVFIIVKLTIRAVTPPQTKTQKQMGKNLVDKIQRLSQISGTPKFVLLFRIVRDIAAPRTDGYIAGLATEAVTLKRDFIELQESFK